MDANFGLPRKSYFRLYSIKTLLLLTEIKKKKNQCHRSGLNPIDNTVRAIVTLGRILNMSRQRKKK